MSDRQAAAFLDRAASYFVAPPEAAVDVAPAATVPRWAPRAAVLGSPADAPPAGAALANLLRAREGDAVAVLAVWSPGREDGPPRAGPSLPATSRVAARLAGRGLAVAARGRLAWVRLPAHPVAASLAARRLAGALEVPLVVALAGTRTDLLDALLPDQDLIVVVTSEPDGPLARLALAGLDRPAVACAPLPAGAARLARAGLAGGRTLDPAVRAAARAAR